MTLINDIADYLEDNALGTVGTNIFFSFVPPTNGTCVVVLDTGGPTPDAYIPTKSPTFQVFIRAATYALGKAKLDAVRDLLHTNDNVAIGDNYFYWIHAMSEGGHIGRNEAGFDEFSINFDTLIR